MEQITGNTKEIVLDEFEYAHEFESVTDFKIGDVIEVPGAFHSGKTSHIKWKTGFQYKGLENNYHSIVEFEVVGFNTFGCDHDKTKKVVISAHFALSGKTHAYTMGDRTVNFDKSEEVSATWMRSNGPLPKKFTVTWKFKIIQRVSTIITPLSTTSGKTVPSEVLQKSLKDLLDSGEFADVTLVTSDGNVPAHKTLLIARSSVFRAMFSTDMLETNKGQVKITDFDKNIVTAMLEYIYTGRTDEVTKRPEEMLQIADKYDLKELRSVCVSIVSSSLKVENAVAKLLLADRFNIKEFKEVVMKFFKTNHLEIAKTEDFEGFIQTNSPLYLEALTGKVADKK